ncbi:MAG TPA: transcription-repair coupling factor [Saprospiraceae bacterium]|nr:transcription-repair coupling factor [Saprospiraceae bacterium]
MVFNIESLIDRYQGSTVTQFVKDKLASQSKFSLKIKGAYGSYSSFLNASLLSNFEQSHLIIAENKEHAAYLHNTLAALVEQKRAYFFPDSFKRPLMFDELNSVNALQRTETINKLNVRNRMNTAIVTYPEAIFEKVVDPELLNKNNIEIEINERLDIDTAIEVLVEYGFERTDFVYEPGQFSIRGGIIDVFSYGNEWPYRIELFDEEVESIRTFNPTDQLSIRNIKKVNIIPDVNIKFKKEDKVSLLDILSSDTIAWIYNEELLIDRLQESFDKALEYINDKQDTMESTVSETLSFNYPKDIIEKIQALNKILLSTPQVFKNDKEIEVATASQPAFNKNFNLLIDNLQGYYDKGYQLCIFSDNARQLERFYNIFEDLEARFKFSAINIAIHEGFIDHDNKVVCYTDHQIFERFHRYKIREGFTKDQAINLRMLRELVPGDFVTHIDHGVGRYSGLEKIDINGHVQESVRLVYLNNDILYVSINSLHKISKYVGKDGTPPKLSKIGGEAWKNLKRKTKSKVKDIANELIKLYAKRKASEGFAFPPDGYLQNELEASFLYEDTPDQYSTTQDVKEDMSKPYPMDRLICGDVGFGKTEIAVRAAFKSIVAGKQVAILVPTTILALQHYKTFSERLNEFGVSVDYINRFRSTKEKNEIYQRIEDGSLELLIGTHAILNKKIKFKDLGLLIIDEEQKFGVASKEKLRNLKVNVDTLTLTATPIPRTLQFSLMAARDLSIIRTPPPNRQPIHTERRVFSEHLIRDAIYYEVNRGGQVFFVHNRVKNLADITAIIQKMCPDVNVRMAHGQMDSDKLEKTLVDFIDGKFDVLVSTNIIETGLDIPNANTMIINNAHQFGMADLHQLRGRVGRSNKKAFCYLFAPPISVLTEDARKRIKTLEEFSDLGSGFHIAMKDMDIRGAGNLLGAEQSGFISDIGYETYQKILEEAVMELKENEYKELFNDELAKQKDFVREVEIDADIEMLIPDSYISSIQERLSLYTELDSIETEDELSKFRTALKDRFGTIPEQVDELFNGLRLRWICKQFGFERMSLKNGTMRCFFISNAQSRFFESEKFKSILTTISDPEKSLNFRLKQTQNYLILIKDKVKNLKEARILLERLQEETAVA